MKTHFSSIERIEANREQLFAWADEGKSYFWMAQQIGINDRNASGGIKFTSAEVRNLSYSLKHLVVNELRTEGKYLLATQKAVDYGIH